MTWMSLGRLSVSVLAAFSGLVALLLVDRVPSEVLLTVLGAVSAALFSVGLTMGWKALDAFSVALREAQQLPKDERTRFRLNSRRRRAEIAAALASLVVVCAFAGGAVLMMKEQAVVDRLTFVLVYGAGTFDGIALMLFFGLFRQYFTGDDLIAEIRDRVTEQLERARQVQDLSMAGDLEARARQALPIRRVVSGS